MKRALSLVVRDRAAGRSPDGIDYLIIILTFICYLFYSFLRINNAGLQEILVTSFRKKNPEKAGARGLCAFSRGSCVRRKRMEAENRAGRPGASDTFSNLSRRAPEGERPVRTARPGSRRGKRQKEAGIAMRRDARRASFSWGPSGQRSPEAEGKSGAAEPPRSYFSMLVRVSPFTRRTSKPVMRVPPARV